MKLPQATKIGILIPFRSSSTTENWDIVCNNLARTLLTLRQQTNKSFRVIVVGHEKPDFEIPLHTTPAPLISFSFLDEFPPPPKKTCTLETHSAYEFDRCRKILKGMIELNKSSSFSHWFALDADDLVHPNLIATLKNLSDKQSAVLDRGYCFRKQSNILTKENQFSAYCGSSAVIADAICNIPQKVTENNFRDVPFGKVSHVHMRDYLLDSGFDTKTISDRLVMYVKDHGANLSDMRTKNTKLSSVKNLVKSLVKQPISKRRVLGSFGIS